MVAKPDTPEPRSTAKKTGANKGKGEVAKSKSPLTGRTPEQFAEDLKLNPDTVIKLLVGDSLETHKTDLLSRFYMRSMQYVTLRVLKFSLGLNVCLMLALLVATFIGIRNIQLVGIDGSAQLIGLQTSSHAEYTNSQIVSFAADTALEVFDFNFINYDRRLERVSNQRFTDEGKRQLQLAMVNLLADVRAMNGQVFIETQGAAQLIAKSNNRFRTQQKVRITLKPADGEAITNTKMLTFTIDKVNDLSSLKGLAVSQTVLGGAS